MCLPVRVTLSHSALASDTSHTAVCSQWPTSSLPVLPFSHCKSSCRPLDFRSCAQAKCDRRKGPVSKPLFHPPLRPRIACQSRSRCFRPSTRVEREEQKESQAAACGRRPLKAVEPTAIISALRALRVSTVGSIVILLWPAIRGRSGGWNKGFDT